MIKLNRKIVVTLLRHAQVLKVAEQKGQQVIISKDPTMRCWDSDTTPSAHQVKVKGYGWQCKKGGEVERQGYITEAGRVIEVKKRKGDKVIQGASILEQQILFFGGDTTSSEEKMYRKLSINNFSPNYI